MDAPEAGNDLREVFTGDAGVNDTVVAAFNRRPEAAKSAPFR